MYEMETLRIVVDTIAKARLPVGVVGIDCDDPNRLLLLYTRDELLSRIKKQLIDIFQTLKAPSNLLSGTSMDPRLLDAVKDNIITQPVKDFPVLQASTAELPGRPQPPVLQPGVQIGFQLQAAFPPTAAGTLGCFVKKKNSSAVFLLTANHILAMNGRARNEPLKPWIEDPTEVFTNPLRFCHPSQPVAALDSVDYLRSGAMNVDECALAELRGGAKPEPKFEFKVLPQPRMPKCGDRVKIQVFREDPATHKEKPYTHKGRVRAVYCWKETRFEFGKFPFFNQFLIQGDGTQQFARKGDSGSLIFLDENGTSDGSPLGMLYAGSPEDNLFLACPLVKCFERHCIEVIATWPPRDELQA